MTNKMPKLKSFKKLVESLDKLNKNDLYNFLETDEFIGPADISDHNHKVIAKLFDAGYPIGFASQSPESYTFRIYVLGATLPSAFQQIIGKLKK